MLNEKQVTNLRVLGCYFITIVVLAISYLIEYLKGSRSIMYVAIYWVLLFIPAVIALIQYRKDSEAVSIRYWVFWGCIIYYIAALLTAASNMAFAYILPTMTILALYRNVKFSILSGCIVSAINVIIIFKRIMNGQLSKVDIIDFEIQIACVILVSIFMCICSKTINEIFESKMMLLMEKQEKERENLIRVLEVTSNISSKIMELSNESRLIEDQSTNSQISMEQIANASKEASDSMNQQLALGTEIYSMSQESLRLAEDSQKKCKATMQKTKVGATNMNELTKVSQESKHVCEVVSNSVEQLTNKMNEAKNILGMIENITKKTSLLSLNASIEAARAGEAGSGFAVVANNIQNLAIQTKAETDNIKSIIASLEEYNQSTVKAVTQLEEVHGRQIHLIDQSKENFYAIEAEMDQVYENADLQTKQMQTVEKANGQLGENINHVNIFVNELNSNADSTKQMTMENLNSIKKMNEFLGNVLQEVKKLEK